MAKLTFHERFMVEALRMAEQALQCGEVPVGAVIVIGEEIVAAAHNQCENEDNPCLHAEFIAMESARRTLGTRYLENARLYVTLEPCPMCAGAAVLNRVESVIYGAADPKIGACGSAVEVIGAGTLPREPGLKSGVLEAECRQPLRDFFEQRR